MESNDQRHHNSITVTSLVDVVSVVIVKTLLVADIVKCELLNDVQLFKFVTEVTWPPYNCTKSVLAPTP